MGIEKSDGKISITAQKPGLTSYEDFDVFSGKDGVSRDEYKASTFHNSEQTDGDAVFNHSADLMETAGTMLFEEETKGETNVEKKEEAQGQ
jgi:hypothetical protein